MRAVVVGGSVVGMSVALAMRKQSADIADIAVLERADGSVGGGGGLGVDVTLLREVTGLRDVPPVYHGPDRDTTAWQLLRDWLAAACEADPAIALHHNANVTDVADGAERAEVTAADGRSWPADVVIGADGVHSTVRAVVDPARPTARYAGYVLWRAMVEEQDIAAVANLPGASEPSRELLLAGYRLVTYLIPGASGDATPGQRRLNIVWYDPFREDLLRSRGRLEGEVVVGSLSADDLPAGLGEELREIAEETWPSPWREALIYALEHRLVFGTPVAEYLPHRLVSGRVAIAGDAAHAATPMVGGGFREGLHDAGRLAGSLQAGGTVASMLADYESARLGPAVQPVHRSQRASQAYLARAQSG